LRAKTVMFIRYFFYGFLFFLIAMPFILLPKKLHFKFFAPLFNRLYLKAPKIKIYNLSKVKFWENHPAIFASNHKCFADFCFISYFLKNAFTILIRSDLMKNVFFRFITWKMGFIPIDRMNVLSQKKALNKAKKMIAKSRYSLIMFPEGWYDFNAILGKLRRGIFKLAKEAKVNIVPVAIYGINENFIFQKKLEWKEVYIKAGDPISYSKFKKSDDFLKYLESEIKRLYYEVELYVSTNVNIN
jgi:1-acyl-sn-glycerol-3-phosphate acyltransferase